MVKVDGYCPFPEKPVSKILSDDKPVFFHTYTHDPDSDFLSFHLIIHIHMCNP